MAGSGTAHLRDAGDELLRVEHLVVEYHLAGHDKAYAVSDVSFDLRRGETLGLVGESGCGKSTVARAVMQLQAPTSGQVLFDGRDLVTMNGRQMRNVRARLQMIFQDPISSLNPLRRVRKIVAEGLDIAGTDDATKVEKVNEIMHAVGLDPDVVGDRRPHEFSGGQCQRVCIARALVLDPELLICDEPVSALDVSVQAQILNLLQDMKARYGLTLLFIAHDLAVVKNMSDRIIVMYLGKICEIADADTIYERPLHPYTSALVSAIPEPDPDAVQEAAELRGDLPSPINPPSGCRFRTRCPRAQSRCAEEEPEIRELEPGHFAACHYPMIGDGASDVAGPSHTAVQLQP
jgi:peptide/nickel transport system ATP-binding protein